ncbi:SWI/SNF and RSC complex subunit Ssr1 [Vermiconidia calcicola]|uniref:SWI/SNF and RSC complex subunit Ssr1 n=1 Tax=Vermiconidia calcicola TaxID=1690605 RepID=A0ACC3MEE1_9PEZI|nr:SWI/SNF and RSC complex subunit Ssr1 [Vermiconidia calcicola]
MKFLRTTTLTAAAIFGLAAAQISELPTCSLGCFTRAIAKSGCGLTDYLCQCTTGAKVIRKSVVQCLCESDSCSASELFEVQDASNKICTAALEEEGEEFTPLPQADNVCAKGGAATTKIVGTATTETATGAATTETTGARRGGSGSSGASDEEEEAPASSSSEGGAAPTKMPVIGAVGLAGLAMLAL